MEKLESTHNSAEILINLSSGGQTSNSKDSKDPRKKGSFFE